MFPLDIHYLEDWMYHFEVDIFKLIQDATQIHNVYEGKHSLLYNNSLLNIQMRLRIRLEYCKVLKL